MIARSSFALKSKNDLIRTLESEIANAIRPLAGYSKTTSCAFLSSLQPRKVVCRNWSSAVSSAYSASQTNFGRTHWIFSLRKDRFVIGIWVSAFRVSAPLDEGTYGGAARNVKNRN